MRLIGRIIRAFIRPIKIKTQSGGNVEIKIKGNGYSPPGSSQTFFEVESLNGLSTSDLLNSKIGDKKIQVEERNGKTYVNFSD